MKGLILKNFMNLKKNLMIFGALTVFYMFFSIAAESSSFFSTIFTMLFAILTISLYAYDDLAKWDTYALTMPISKDNLVQEKFFMMLLLTFIGMVYSSIFTLIFNIVTKAELLQDFQIIGAGAAIVVFFYCIIIPFITKLGVEKARLIYIVVYMIPFIIVLMVQKMLGSGGVVIPESILKLADMFIKNVYIIVPVVLIVALILSYHISVQIYRKKEF